MRIIEQIDDNTRIVVKFSFSALRKVFCLQRKRFLFWKTTSWMYPNIMARNNRDYDYLKHWLFWDESDVRKSSINKVLSTKKH